MGVLTRQTDLREIFDRFNNAPVDIFMEAFNEHLNEPQKTEC